MSGEWPAGAADYVQAIADTKLVLSHWYAECAFLGPHVADNIALLSMVQDEYGHARQLFFQLERQGRDADWLRGEREADAFANAATTDRPADGWLEFVVRTGLTDRAALLLVDAIVHDDFAGLTEKIGEEEYAHLEFHDAWFETLADDQPDGFEAALEATLPDVVAFVGPAAHDEEGDPLLAAGFTDRSVAELREALLAHYEELLSGTAVSVPAIDGPALDEWDAERRRTVGGGIEERVLNSLRGVENREFAAE